MTKPKLPWVRMVVYLPFALVNVAAGLGCLLSGIPFVIPIGLFLLVMSAWPYAGWFSKKITADIAYAERDHTLNEGESMPWEEVAQEFSEDELMEIILNTHGRGSQP